MKAPSNRRLLDTALAWGWEIRRQQGETVDLRWLATRDVVTVFAATYHAGNPAPVVNRIVKITTDGDHARFWSRTPRTDTVAPAPAPVTPVATLPTPATPEPEQVDGPPSAAYTRGNARGALIFLSARGSAPTTPADVADHLGIDAAAARNALAHLVTAGQAERLVRGAYRIAGAAAAAPRPAAPAAPPPVPTTGRDVVPSAPPAYRRAVTAETAEADMLAVLDLIVPTTGIPLAALPLIDQWRTTTRALIAALGGPS